VFAPSEQYRDMYLEEASVQAVLGKARQADLALLTVGDLSERSLMLELGLVNDEDARSLRAAGAVGDLLGRWLDRDGIEVDHPLNRRAVSLDLEDLRRIKKVVLVSGGPYRPTSFARCCCAMSSMSWSSTKARPGNCSIKTNKSPFWSDRDGPS
jgi:DNA-binding transcriptional regulator LsrR (DeoR family)